MRVVSCRGKACWRHRAEKAALYLPDSGMKEWQIARVYVSQEVKRKERKGQARWPHVYNSSAKPDLSELSLVVYNPFSWEGEVKGEVQGRPGQF